MSEVVFDLIGVLARPSWRELVADPSVHDWRKLRVGAINEEAFWEPRLAAAYRRAFGLRRDRVELLMRLRAAGHGIVIASNFARAWARMVQAHMPAGLVGRWVISGEVGAAKPEPAFFTALAAARGTVMVDDQAGNLAAAEAAGLRGVLAAPGCDLATQVARALARG